jgi:transcriptional regulator with XRE-family HTH domain
MKYSAILIKNIRKKLGLSQQKFADAIGVPFKLISNIEYDQSSLTQQLLEKINITFPDLNLNVMRELVICVLSKNLGRMPQDEEINQAMESISEQPPAKSPCEECLGENAELVKLLEYAVRNQYGLLVLALHEIKTSPDSLKKYFLDK